MQFFKVVKIWGSNRKLDGRNPSHTDPFSALRHKPAGLSAHRTLAEIPSSCFFSRGESLNALTADAEAVLGEAFKP